MALDAMPPTETETPEADPLKERERIVRIHLRRREQGRGPLDLYRVPIHEPFSRTVIEDCALYLGRLYAGRLGDELDVGRTLDATLATGRPCPIFAPTLAPRELVVLYDIEAGAPPFLSGFLRLLDALVRLGVQLHRYAFVRNPDHLSDHPRWDLATLGHRHPGAALLLFARFRGRDLRHLRWLRHLPHFHRCAWLDPVPQAPAHRSSAGRRVRESLLRAGIHHVPYTPRGLFSLGRYLASGERAPAPISTLPDGPTLARGLQRWAAAAAVVPDASWDQLEEFRRRIALLHHDLPDQRQIEQLLDWVRRHDPDLDPEVGGRLLLSEARERQLVDHVRENEPAFEKEVRGVVLAQLRQEPPVSRAEDPFLHHVWELKRACHLAVDRADPMLVEGLLNGPLGREARSFLRQELGRPGFSKAQKERLRILLLGERSPLHSDTSVRPTMIPIPAGEFLMGSEDWHDDERPVHLVKISRPFFMAETPVTQAQYRAVMGINPAYATNRGESGECPVERVSWLDTIKFCNHLSRREHIPPAYLVDSERVRWIANGPGYRLPTEAEWEYAARAGATTKYAGSDEPDGVAWYSANSAGTTQPVRRKSPNAWGIYDMSGNVWEWVWDWYGRYDALHAIDPQGSDVGQSRVVRGGSGIYVAESARVTYRGLASPGNRNDHVGFRIAKSSL